MKTMLFLLALSFGFPSYSQEKLVCHELPAVEVKCWIMLNGKSVRTEINSAGLSGNDLVLALADPTFKVIGFRFWLGCRSGFLFYDMTTRDYWGSKLPKGDRLARSLRAGDLIAFSCITVEKEGKLYKLKSTFPFEIY